MPFIDTDYAQDLGFRNTRAFQEWEWGEHGMCAGVKDADDYFGHTECLFSF